MADMLKKHNQTAEGQTNMETFQKVTTVFYYNF